MTGTTGLFTKKIRIRAYVDNAGGLRVGAPVRLEGVDIGNVIGIRVVRDPSRQVAPVEILMKITTKYQNTMGTDCEAHWTRPECWARSSSTWIAATKGGWAAKHTELPTRDVPQLQDVVRASQRHAGKCGHAGQAAGRYRDLHPERPGIDRQDHLRSVALRSRERQPDPVATDLAQINSPNGTIGKLVNSDELYNKANAVR